MGPFFVSKCEIRAENATNEWVDRLSVWGNHWYLNRNKYVLWSKSRTIKCIGCKFSFVEWYLACWLVGERIVAVISHESVFHFDECKLLFCGLFLLRSFSSSHFWHYLFLLFICLDVHFAVFSLFKCIWYHNDNRTPWLVFQHVTLWNFSISQPNSMLRIASVSLSLCILFVSSGILPALVYVYFGAYICICIVRCCSDPSVNTLGILWNIALSVVNSFLFCSIYF